MKWLWRILGILLGLLVVLFFVFRVPDTDPVEMRAKYATAPSQLVKLADGREIHLRDEGPRDAPVIILLHGSNADLSSWQKWTEALRDKYRVIRFDQRGHGLTGPAPDDDYDLTAFVDDVDEVADALEVGTFTLGGNSMGGGIAMEYAIANPDRLDALILVDAGGAPIERKGSGNLAFTLAGKPVIGDLMSQLLPRSLVEKSLSQSVSNQAVVTPETVDRYWEMARYPGARAATRKRFSTPRRSFSAESVAAMQVPTLVMWGEEDALIPYDAAGWYMDHLPNAKLVHYPGIGHLPMEEAPEKSVADLTAWLDKTLATRRPASAEPVETLSVSTP
ncbi:alpha/beta fold hydrolase [Qipengyuania soli]|uniref:Alpha/beta hydrolase n=1 Tax=Qipengyuania soli TaxID=2782568 RepID=A0A7S8F5L9_9SPHN|nr:alpha/beta hydrolase [Qipengyuania soli]QPC99517.1 alpha/beta hydrolase [Qipengyuania soli]